MERTVKEVLPALENNKEQVQLQSINSINYVVNISKTEQYMKNAIVLYLPLNSKCICQHKVSKLILCHTDCHSTPLESRT